jgi:hypothetical protein
MALRSDLETARPAVAMSGAVLAEGKYVIVHTGAGITQPGQGAPIGCGDIRAD